MDCGLLVRPEVKVKKKTGKEKVLPADLAAAYACYHVNLVERRKLEQKWHIIDIETKQMKRDFRYQREVLEKEMKKAENDYWNCHRVFSAATLITESDSYRKRFYTGPQPTKAKLPLKKLERLSQLVRSLQAEDDLETLSRFQRCARYVFRKAPEVHHESGSSLTTLSEEGSGKFEALEQQHLTEMLNERSTDKVGKLGSNTSIKEKRIRSAPVRVTSRTGTLGEFNKRRYSASPQQHSPKKLELDISQISPSKVDESKGITHSGGREKALVRFAWTEKEKPDATVDDIDAIDTSLSHTTVKEPSKVEESKEITHSGGGEKALVRFAWTEKEKPDTTVDDIDAIDTSLSHATVKEPSRDNDLMQTSLEHETSRSSGHQSYDVNLLSTSSECRISRGSSGRISSHQDSLGGESSFVHEQSKEAEISELDYRESKFSTTCQDQAYIESPEVENQIGGDENLEFDSSSAKGATTPRSGWDLIRIAYMDNKKPSVSTFCDTLKGTKTESGRKISVTLPKSSLQGLSSGRKSLTPRDQHKPIQRHHRASIKAEDKHEVGNNSAYLHSKIMMLPKNADKRPDKEREAHKKKRVSIFKRACLSDALFSEQTQVESQLRNRVQGFLGAIYDGDKTSEKGEE